MSNVIFDWLEFDDLIGEVKAISSLLNVIASKLALEGDNEDDSNAVFLAERVLRAFTQKLSDKQERLIIEGMKRREEAKNA